MRVVVTGANGFIGSHLVPSLLGEKIEVTKAIEKESDVPSRIVSSVPVDVVHGDGLREAFTGADAVVHLAARNHVLKETERDPLSAYRRVNVEGTRNVVRACLDAGVRTIVHVSSVKVMGDGGDGVFDEDSPFRPSTPYAVSKMEAEVVVRDEVKRGGIRAVIIRLPMVYGPRNKGNLLRLIRWASIGLPLPVREPDNHRSMIYVKNVAAGIVAVLRLGPAGVSTYIIKDDGDRSVREVFTTICRVLGHSPRFIRVHGSMARWLGMISRDLRTITESFRVCSGRIEAEIGFRPEYSFEEGIEGTVSWFRSTE